MQNDPIFEILKEYIFNISNVMGNTFFEESIDNNYYEDNIQELKDEYYNSIRLK